MSEQAVPAVDPNDPIFDEFPLHLRGLLDPGDLCLLLERSANGPNWVEGVIIDALRDWLHPPSVLAIATGSINAERQKPMRFGCPNGHNSEYTVFGQHNHTCAACGATHTLTAVPEDPPSRMLFGGSSPGEADRRAQE